MTEDLLTRSTCDRRIVARAKPEKVTLETGEEKVLMQAIPISNPILDQSDPVKGRLVLSLESPGGQEVAGAEHRFTLEGGGRETYPLTLNLPHAAGKYLLKASASPQGSGPQSATVSRRQVELISN